MIRPVSLNKKFKSIVEDNGWDRTRNKDTLVRGFPMVQVRESEGLKSDRVVEMGKRSLET